MPLHQSKPVLLLIILAVMLPGFYLYPGHACAQIAENVPSNLKTAPGVETQGAYLYATGMARVEVIAGRAGKAFELALKKSRLRAMQLIHMEASCGSMFEGLEPELHLGFLGMLCGVTPPVNIEGIIPVKQWKTENAAYTTVAVPITSLHDVACPYDSLASAISHYIDGKSASMNGLAFLLEYLPRHTELYQRARHRTGRWFQQHGMTEQALCFLDMPVEQGSVTAQFSSVPAPAMALALQNLFGRAAEYVSRAEQTADKGEWSAATAHANMALDLLPGYSRAFIILSDSFYSAIHRPSLALGAAEKAMRDGTMFYEALGRMIQCLKAMNSPESEVYEYLYSQAVVVPQSSGLWSTHCPSSWKPELRRFGDYPVRNLVVWSLGNAFEGKSARPGQAFRKAAGLYSQARDNSQVEEALDLLLDTCEHDPLSAETYNLIGACYRHLGRHSMALPFLWQALKLRPGYDLALTNLGLCCKELKLMRSAEYYFSYDAVKDSSNAWVRDSYEKFMH